MKLLPEEPIWDEEAEEAAVDLYLEGLSTPERFQLKSRKGWYDEVVSRIKAQKPKNTAKHRVSAAKQAPKPPKKAKTANSGRFTPESSGKFGSKGGKSRAQKLSPARRKAIARAAAQARWGK
jgi:hypothetical protein